MKEFLEYLLKQIVSKPEDIAITENEEDGIKVYLVKVAPEDMGIVIGKEGRNIKSIRNMAKAKAIKDNVRISVVLQEENQ